MSWTHDDWKNVIFSDQSMQNLAIGKRKIVAGVVTTNENTDDGGKVGISDFSTTNARTYTENINDQLYCDVLQNEVK